MRTRCAVGNPPATNGWLGKRGMPPIAADRRLGTSAVPRPRLCAWPPKVHSSQPCSTNAVHCGRRVSARSSRANVRHSAGQRTVPHLRQRRATWLGGQPGVGNQAGRNALCALLQRCRTRYGAAPRRSRRVEEAVQSGKRVACCWGRKRPDTDEISRRRGRTRVVRHHQTGLTSGDQPFWDIA